MSNDKNRETSHQIVQYASGPWNGKWVVRRTITEDVAATLTRVDAEALMRALEKEPSK